MNIIFFRATQILNSLCRSVTQGQQAGNICHWLCNENRNYTLTGFYKGGSKNVFKVNRDGKNLILKMHHSFIKDYDVLDSRVKNEEFTDKVRFFFKLLKLWFIFF